MPITMQTASSTNQLKRLRLLQECTRIRKKQVTGLIADYFKADLKGHMHIWAKLHKKTWNGNWSSWSDFKIKNWQFLLTASCCITRTLRVLAHGADKVSSLVSPHITLRDVSLARHGTHISIREHSRILTATPSFPITPITCTRVRVCQEVTEFARVAFAYTCPDWSSSRIGYSHGAAMRCDWLVVANSDFWCVCLSQVTDIEKTTSFKFIYQKWKGKLRVKWFSSYPFEMQPSVKSAFIKSDAITIR